MPTLIRRADALVTMDDASREIRDAAIVVRGDAIAWVGADRDVDAWIAEDPAARTPVHTIDARGCVLMPGLVNAHHHLYQTLTRAIGTSGGKVLFDWLRLLYPIWGGMDPEAVPMSAKLGMSELMHSGA